MPFTCTEVPNEVEIDEPVELHGHARNSRADGDGRMEMNAQYLRGRYGVFVHIGNGKPAILDQASADRELAKLKACLADDDTALYAAPLLRDDTTPEMIRETRLRHPRNVLFWKAFLSGVSNDGGNSVTSFKKLRETLTAFYAPLPLTRKMVLHVHAERATTRTGKTLQMRDREWYAVRKDVAELLRAHPHLTVVLKHVSDRRTLRQVAKWREQGYEIYVEICPHYLFRCHEDLYKAPGGGTAFNLHLLCWPLYKDEKSMQALREAVLAGYDWVMYGTDWACHADDPARESGVKVNRNGIVVGGVTILPDVALSLVIGLFVDAGRTEHLDAYLSRNARRVHDLPAARRRVRYGREPWLVPERIVGLAADSDSIEAVTFMGGQRCEWQKAA